MSYRGQSFLATPGCPVGSLSEWNPHTNTTSNILTIYSNEEIYVGRDPKRCRYVIDDPFVSNRHLRIYTIIFDRENPQEVAPLVYVQDISMNGTTWNGYPMGKGNGSFLLSDGDMLKMSPKAFLLYRRGEHIEEDCFDVLQRFEMRVFENQYTITPRKLGSGAFGKVHMAFDKNTGHQFACKIIDLRILRDKFIREAEDQQSRFFDKEARTPYGKGRVIAGLELNRDLPRRVQEKLDVYNREAKILEGLCHPNIISVEKVIKSSQTIYIFQDLVTSGDLFSYIQYKGGRLGDIEAAVIVRQVLMALDYLHDRNIVHRDLKPDNILMTSLADGCRVVLTDFGCARLVEPTVERMTTVVGTFDYTAPEVLRSIRGGYTKAVDLWSLGCVTVVLLTGDTPFKNSLNPTSTNLTRKKDLEKLEADLEWNNTGQRAADFVRRLLVFDEAGRMDVKQALLHSWFTNRVLGEEFEALYRRSIRDWKPHEHKSESLIVNLADLIEPRKELSNEEDDSDGRARPKSSGSDDNQNQVLAHTKSSSSSSVSISDIPFHRQHAAPSPTLSDPELPQYHKEV